MDVKEHIYADDPARGHPDVRTNPPRTEYYFLGNGLIQAALQVSHQSGLTPLGLLLMDPEFLGPKRSSPSLDPVEGLAATAASLIPGGGLPALEPGRLRIDRTEIGGLPAVRAAWEASGWKVIESFFCPDRTLPRLVRIIRVRNGRPGSRTLTLRTGLKETTISRTSRFPSCRELAFNVEYALAGRGRPHSASCSWCGDAGRRPLGARLLGRRGALPLPPSLARSDGRSRPPPAFRRRGRLGETRRGHLAVQPGMGAGPSFGQRSLGRGGLSRDGSGHPRAHPGQVRGRGRSDLRLEPPPAPRGMRVRPERSFALGPRRLRVLERRPDFPAPPLAPDPADRRIPARSGLSPSSVGPAPQPARILGAPRRPRDRGRVRARLPAVRDPRLGERGRDRPAARTGPGRSALASGRLAPAPGGGYGRYHVSSEPDSPGPWPFPSLFAARAYFEAGQDSKVWRILDWLGRIQGGRAGSWFEFYGPRPVPPCPQIGIIPWTWAEIIFLLVRHILGVRPTLDGLLLRPRLPAGLDRAGAELPLRGRVVKLDLERCERSARPAVWIDGRRGPLGRRGIFLPYDRAGIPAAVRIALD